MTKKSNEPEIDKVKAELVAALLEDESRLGEVYRLLQEGLSPEQMAERMGIPSAIYATHYRKQLEAILEGRMPATTHLASHTADRLRRWQRSKDWTPPAREHLETLLVGLENIATDTKLVERERHDAAKRTQEAESLGLAGIYVYSLPHYLRHPFDPDSDRTLFKVGHSTIDVYSGAEGTARTMSLPEDPILLRVYVTGAKPSDQEERHFREWMEAAGHGRSRSAKGNRDWFLTTTKFLDRVALQRGLEITVVTDID